MSLRILSEEEGPPPIMSEEKPPSGAAASSAARFHANKRDSSVGSSDGEGTVNTGYCDTWGFRNLSYQCDCHINLFLTFQYTPYLLFV